MLTSYNIKYPMVNTNIPGLRDICVILRGFQPSSTIVPGDPYISQIYRVSDNTFITLNIPYGTGSYVLEVTPGITERDNISVNILVDPVQFEEGVTELINSGNNTFTEFTGAIEPCTVIWSLNQRQDVTYKINEVYEQPNMPTLNSNITFLEVSPSYFILSGGIPVSEEIKTGINVINGIVASNLELAVSNSLLMETDNITGTINVRPK